MGFWNLVNTQDIEIVERVQEGISNPAYRGGRMRYQFEETLYRYQKHRHRQNSWHRPYTAGRKEEAVRMFRSNGAAEGK